MLQQCSKFNNILQNILILILSTESGYLTHSMESYVPKIDSIKKTSIPLPAENSVQY